MDGGGDVARANAPGFFPGRRPPGQTRTPALATADR